MLTFGYSFLNPSAQIGHQIVQRIGTNRVQIAGNAAGLLVSRNGRINFDGTGERVAERETGRERKECGFRKVFHWIGM